MPVAIEKIAVLRATRSPPPRSASHPRRASTLRAAHAADSSPKLPSGMPITSPGRPAGAPAGASAPGCQDKAAIVRRSAARPGSSSRAASGIVHGQHPLTEEADPPLRARAAGEPPLHLGDQDATSAASRPLWRAATRAAAETEHRELSAHDRQGRQARRASPQHRRAQEVPRRARSSAQAAPRAVACGTSRCSAWPRVCADGI